LISRTHDTAIYLDTLGNPWPARVVVAAPPSVLLTNGDADGSRLRVDVAQTGFFVGREFRTFRRITTGAGATTVIRAVVPVNTILFSLQLELTDGWIDIETRVGGTDGGTFSETLPIFRRNNMSTAPVITPQVVLTAGGTHTGGTVIDVIAVRAANATAQASSVGGGITDERGIAPSTYYFVLTNPGAGAASGVFRAWWEERA